MEIIDIIERVPKHWFLYMIKKHFNNYILQNNLLKIMFEDLNCLEL